MIRPVRCCQMMQETKTSQIIMWNQIPCSGSINFFDMNSEELLSYGLLKFSVFPVLVLWRGIDIRKKWALQSKGVSFALRSTCNSITYKAIQWNLCSSLTLLVFGGKLWCSCRQCELDDLVLKLASTVDFVCHKYLFCWNKMSQHPRKLQSNTWPTVCQA